MFLSQSESPSFTTIKNNRYNMAPEIDTCVVASPESWLNKNFLETALRSYRKPSNLRVTKFDVKAAVGKGDNYCSDLYRVKVHVSDGSVYNLIIKRELSEDGEIARIVKNSTVFSREIYMYSTTAVELAKILQEAMPVHEGRPLEGTKEVELKLRRFNPTSGWESGVA
ncbi:hypothetical protein ANN_18357 [Periplaneta americana]|uniref:Uncharacterized protein n=1 Tax=Periplaneta americana TaxID=6978 RepID=A0ABQ8SPS3_PERAM|nr:hypothetical protein ANN_18357 [Periplaneta americana]